MTDLSNKLYQVQTQIEQGKYEAAAIALQRLIPKHGNVSDVHGMLCSTFLRMRKYDQAIYAAERALEISPDSPYMLHDCALAWSQKGDGKRAEEIMRRVIEIAPTFAPARLHLANLALDRQNAREAAEHCEVALANESNAMVLVTYIGALLQQGRVAEANQTAKESLAKYPNERMLATAYATTLNSMDDADPAESAAAHRLYGELVRARADQEAPILAKQGMPIGPWLKRTPGVALDGNMPLRVGIVTADARTHSCAFFLLPLLQRLKERSGTSAAGAIEVVVYSTNLVKDSMTDRIKAAAHIFRDCAQLTEILLAQKIRDDRVHILIDLMGHTLGDSLMACELRPAPVQVTYLGYPNTTGLTSMDWRIVDSQTDPTGDGPWGLPFDQRATERLFRLDPCFLCYRPPQGDVDSARDEVVVPEPRWTTALSRDPAAAPVFGSFNASTKLSDGTIACWAAVLRGCPHSRIVLKAGGFSDPAVREHIVMGFRSFGVAAERIEFLERTKSIHEHLSLYASIDIALDSFPYNGTTTTCEAMWMGVPVITKAGRTHAARVGVSLLLAAGVAELIAADESSDSSIGPDSHANYVSCVKALVQDHARLTLYRKTLRQQMARSPLCDEASFAERFAGALRAMWREFV